MRWCRFSRFSSGDEVVYGIVEGDRVIPVDGSPFGEYSRSSASFSLSEVQLDIPVVPGTFYCAGANYRDHIVAMAAKRGTTAQVPTRPDIGYRANSALIAHGEAIVKPPDAGPELQYEGELVAVIGRTIRGASPAESLDAVLGWTIGNDVTERAWQMSDRTLWRAKNSDTFKPMGPWIETEARLGSMETTVRLNGTVVDRFNTDNMIFSPGEFISEVSRYCTLRPGDVMWMGTDGAPRNIGDGDTVEIEISGIGTLRNQVVQQRQ